MLGLFRGLAAIVLALASVSANASIVSPDFRLETLEHDINASANADYRRGHEAFKEGDVLKAIEWFRKAADDGDVKAQTNLGVLYLFGYSLLDGSAQIADSNNLALKYLGKAADQGDGAAFHYIGYMHDPQVAGSVEPVSMEEALKWYRKAADLGHAPAMSDLAAIYGTPDSGLENIAEAKTWLLKAAEHGDADSSLSLAVSFEDGDPRFGISQDFSQALTWYRKAAEQGSAEGQDKLGSIHELGRGVPQDYAQAVYWYRKSADQGNLEAEFHLGNLYRDGKGVGQDFSQAAYWYRRAAAQWQTSAQLGLAELLRDGQGVERDPVSALMWFQLAIELITSRAEDSTVPVRNASLLAEKMSAAETAEAERRAKVCTESELKDCGGPDGLAPLPAPEQPAPTPAAGDWHAIAGSFKARGDAEARAAQLGSGWSVMETSACPNFRDGYWIATAGPLAKAEAKAYASAARKQGAYVKTCH